MTPIIEGVDGVQKMSKSLKNHIGIAEPPQVQFNKTMAIPDAIMERWFRYFTDVPENEYKSLLAAGNPRDAKLRLGRGIVELYHGKDAAAKASDEWMRTVSGGALPENIPSFTVSTDRIAVLKLLTEVLKFESSNSKARQLIEGGGVEIDGKRIDDVKAEIDVKGGEVVRAGKKRYARLARG
jgi:tyrosyl-tRNA synthetase